MNASDVMTRDIVTVRRGGVKDGLALSAADFPTALIVRGVVGHVAVWTDNPGTHTGRAPRLRS